MGYDLYFREKESFEEYPESILDSFSFLRYVLDEEDILGRSESMEYRLFSEVGHDEFATM